MVSSILLLLLIAYVGHSHGVSLAGRRTLVLTNDVIFDQNELELILAFSTDEHPLIAMDLSRVPQAEFDHPFASTTLFFVPPFNMTAISEYPNAIQFITSNLHTIKDQIAPYVQIYEAE